MYKLNFDGWPLYDPRGANKIDRLIILEPEVEIGVNKAGSIKFAVPPGHPNADKITKMCGTLELTDDAGVLFRGRVLDDRQTFDKSTHYTAEGALAWLNDGIVEPYDFPADFQSDPAYQAAAATGNVVAFFLGWLLDGYNAHAAPDRQIKLGNVTVTDPNNYITRADSNYPSTFEVLSKKLAGSALGGYMVMRYEADGNYLDYLSTFVGTNAQEITFGENLLDLVQESTAADLYTAVLPIGADGLTLAGLPDGPQENGLVKAGKVLYNPQAEAEYGRIIRKVEYTDITLADNLLRTAAKDMGAEIRLPESLQVRACDLHYLDGKTPSFRLGLYTVVVSAPHGIVRKSYPLTDLQPNLLNPAATPITLNGAASQLTARLRQAQQAEQERTESAIRAVVKETSAILDEIIKSASGLYCTPEVQPDGSTIYYLHDKPTLAESTNVIKLTADAIGFSTDGGHNYPYGFTVTGDMVARVLSASGVNAEWIRAGVLQSVDGKTFFLDLEKGILRMEATELTISGKSVNAALQAAVTDVENQYYLSDSATVLAGGSWEPSQPAWTQGKFIWTRQYVTYGDGSTAYLPDETGVCITGNTGANGTDGRGVLSSLVSYQASPDGTTAPTGEWADKIPDVPAGQFLWTRTVITYTDGNASTLYSVSRSGKDGQDGKDGDNGTNGTNGVGIESITNYYLASASASGVTTDTPGWSTDVQSVSADRPYLWNYEVTAYTDGASTIADPHIVGTYGRDGADGEAGKGIKSITEHYLATSESSGVTIDTEGWTETLQVTDTTNRYLWNYETIVYTDGSTDTVLPRIIGTHGTDGASARVIVTANGGTTAQLEEWSAPGHRGGLYPVDSAVMDTLKVGDQVCLRLRNNETDSYVYIIGTVYRLTRAGEEGSSRDTIWYEAAGMLSNGVDGLDGIGIDSIVTEYIQSPSSEYPEEDPEATWGADVPPELFPDYFLWSRQKITYSDGHVEYAGIICLTKTVGEIAQQKIDAMSALDMFNKLTDNGAKQGLYIDPVTQELYINASFVKSGILDIAMLLLSTAMGGITDGEGSTKYSENGVWYSRVTHGIMVYGPNGVITDGNGKITGVKDPVPPPFLLVSTDGARLQAAEAYVYAAGGICGLGGHIVVNEVNYGSEFPRAQPGMLFFLLDE